MDKKVLIFSTQLAFIEFSRNCLAEIKNIEIQSASTIEEIQTLTDQTEFDLVILDAEFPEDSTVEEIVSIQEQHVSTRFLVFPPDNRQNHPVISQLRVDAFLSQPFYLPDFLDIVKKLVYRTQIQESNLDGTEINSLGDNEMGKTMQQTLSEWANPTKIGEQLSQAIIESQAQGAFILYDGNPIVYRGDLNESVISEITIYLLQDWDRDKKSDIVRFMRLNADGKDHLIYASKFQESHLLVLIFEKTLPIMVARSQFTRVAFNLKNLIDSSLDKNYSEEINEIEGFIDDTKIEKEVTLSESDVTETQDDESQMKVSQLFDHLTGIEASETQDPTKALQREYKTDESDMDPDLVLPEWLEDEVTEVNEDKDTSNEIEQDDQLHWIKSGEQQETEETTPAIELGEDKPKQEGPDMSNQDKSSDRISLRRFEQDQAGEDILDSITFPWDQEVGQELEAIPSEEIEHFIDEDKIQSGSEEIEYQEFSSENELSPKELLSDLIQVENGRIEKDSKEKFIEEVETEKTDSSFDETIPMFVHRNLPDNISVLEPIFAGLGSLNYTSILIPRFPKQYLVGDLAKRMGIWMPQLCLAFGWRLDRLSIRPQYIQWTITADPTVTPNELIKLIRKETSNRIFKLRPDYMEENPSNDFWAPGYMVLSGYYPPTQQMLTDFIQNTRRRQGLET